MLHRSCKATRLRFDVGIASWCYNVVHAGSLPTICCVRSQCRWLLVHNLRSCPSILKTNEVQWHISLPNRWMENYQSYNFLCIPNINSLLPFNLFRTTGFLYHIHSCQYIRIFGVLAISIIWYLESLTVSYSCYYAYRPSIFRTLACQSQSAATMIISTWCVI